MMGQIKINNKKISTRIIILMIKYKLNITLPFSIFTATFIDLLSFTRSKPSRTTPVIPLPKICLIFKSIGDIS